MALNNSATLVPAGGDFYMAAVGTARPGNPLTPGVSWTKIGHTSLEDILSITSEGGETTILGTLQNKALRTRRSPRTETFTFTLQQWDEAGLKLYFGSNSIVQPDGTIGVPQDPTPTAAAFLAVFYDGEEFIDFFAQKSEILRGDDMAIGDTESLAGLPISVTPLIYGSNTWPYTVKPLGRPDAETAVAGDPGEYEPEGAQPPYALADLTGVEADPATAWTTGQHVVLGDGTSANWNGTAWEAGEA